MTSSTDENKTNQNRAAALKNDVKDGVIFKKSLFSSIHISVDDTDQKFKVGLVIVEIHGAEPLIRTSSV